MAQVRLVNKSKRPTRIGDLVKINLPSKNSFLIAEYTDTGIIGTASQITTPGGWCLINLINTVNWADVINKPTITTPDLSGLQPKETGKSLVLDTDISKLSSLPIITVSATEPSNPVMGQIWIDIS